MTDIKTATVTELPDCDICKQHGKKEPAEYDSRTIMGPWANLCETHYQRIGVKPLGTGRGQKLVLPTKQPDELTQRADLLCGSCGLNCAEDSFNKTEVRFRLLDDHIKQMVMLSMGLSCEEI